MFLVFLTTKPFKLFQTTTITVRTKYIFSFIHLFFLLPQLSITCQRLLSSPPPFPPPESPLVFGFFSCISGWLSLATSSMGLSWQPFSTKWSSSARNCEVKEHWRITGICFLYLYVSVFLFSPVTILHNRENGCVLTYCSLSCRQSSLPADVYESRCDDDHTDRADYHQNYKQFAVVAVYLTGPRLATTGSTVVLDAHLITQTHTISSLHIFHHRKNTEFTNECANLYTVYVVMTKVALSKW